MEDMSSVSNLLLGKFPKQLKYTNEGKKVKMKCIKLVYA